MIRYKLKKEGRNDRKKKPQHIKAQKVEENQQQIQFRLTYVRKESKIHDEPSRQICIQTKERAF